MDRYGYDSYREEHQPVIWVRGYPLFAAHFIVAVYVVSMIGTTATRALHVPFMFEWLPFTTANVFSGQAWRIFTYGLVNLPSIPFVIDMLMMVWFGREVEKHYGRKKFLTLYGGIYLLPPLLLTLLGAFLPTRLAGQFGALALFVAFATLNPNVPLMFNVLAKWAAIILVGIYTLMALADNQWAWLVAIWSSNGFAHLFVRYERGDFTLPRFRLGGRKPNLRVLPDLPAAKFSPKRAAAETTMAEVDALLDKIATSGMSSLTPKERAKLNAARDDIVKRESGRR